MIKDKLSCQLVCAGPVFSVGSLSGSADLGRIYTTNDRALDGIADVWEYGSLKVGTLTFIGKNIECRSQDIMMPLYIDETRVQLYSCTVLVAIKLERLQKRYSMMLPGLAELELL